MSKEKLCVYKYTNYLHIYFLMNIPFLLINNILRIQFTKKGLGDTRSPRKRHTTQVGAKNAATTGSDTYSSKKTKRIKKPSGCKSSGSRGRRIIFVIKTPIIGGIGGRAGHSPAVIRSSSSSGISGSLRLRPRRRNRQRQAGPFTSIVSPSSRRRRRGPARTTTGW